MLFFSSGVFLCFLLPVPCCGPYGTPDRISETESELEALWLTLKGSESMCAYQAIVALSVSKADVPGFLARRLTDSPAGGIDQLIAELSSPHYGARERALQKLKIMGIKAERNLENARAESLEAKRRIEILLMALGPEKCAIGRAVEVLERIGNEAAEKALIRIIENPLSPTAQREAQRSLNYLKRR